MQYNHNIRKSLCILAVKFHSYSYNNCDLHPSKNWVRFVDLKNETIFHQINHKITTLYSVNWGTDLHKSLIWRSRKPFWVGWYHPVLFEDGGAVHCTTELR